MANYQSVTPVQIATAAVTNVDTLIFTATASTRLFIKDINIANTNVAARTINLHIVPSTGTVGTGNALMYNLSIAPNTVYRWTGTQIMNSEDKLYVKASDTGLTVFVSGAEAV
jgi:hypothetical protein